MGIFGKSEVEKAREREQAETQYRQAKDHAQKDLLAILKQATTERADGNHDKFKENLALVENALRVSPVLGVSNIIHEYLTNGGDPRVIEDIYTAPDIEERFANGLSDPNKFGKFTSRELERDSLHRVQRNAFIDLKDDSLYTIYGPEYHPGKSYGIPLDFEALKKAVQDFPTLLIENQKAFAGQILERFGEPAAVFLEETIKDPKILERLGKFDTVLGNEAGAYSSEVKKAVTTSVKKYRDHVAWQQNNQDSATNNWLQDMKTGDMPPLTFHTFTEVSVGPNHYREYYDREHFVEMARGLLRDQFERPEGMDEKGFTKMIDGFWNVSRVDDTTTLHIASPRDQTDFHADLVAHDFKPNPVLTERYQKIAPRGQANIPGGNRPGGSEFNA